MTLSIARFYTPHQRQRAWPPAALQAEAELLAAITLFFERVGLSSKDVGIKVSNRKVTARTRYAGCQLLQRV